MRTGFEGFKSLPQLYREFINQHREAASALQSKEAAEASHISIVKALFKFLKANDTDCDILIGRGFRHSLNECSSAIETLVKESTENTVRRSLSHGVVRVNSIILDPTHKRLGKYVTLDNYPFSEFMKLWEGWEKATHLAELTFDKLLPSIEKAKQETRLPLKTAEASAKKKRIKRVKVLV